MDFSREDIARLYGSRLFILSGQTEGVAAPTPQAEPKAEAAPVAKEPEPIPEPKKPAPPPEPKIPEPTL